MAVLDNYANRYMSRYLEKTDGNINFHEIIDFPSRSSIHYALTVTYQAKEIKHLKAQIKNLKKKAKPVITHHKAWMKSVSMKQRLAGKKSLKTKWMQKESISKQGRKLAKAEPTVHKDPAFDDLDDIVDDAIDYMESEDAQDEGRTSSVVFKEKESTQKGVSTEIEVSTIKPDEGIDKAKVSTDKPEVSTVKPKEVEVSTDKLDEGTAEPKDGTLDKVLLLNCFQRLGTIAEFLVFMSQNKAKQKGVEIKDAEDSDRPRATSPWNLNPVIVCFLKVGEVSYRLALPSQLSHVHNVFRVSLLRGYNYHPYHVIQYSFDKIREDLSFAEEPEAILDRQERVMRKKIIHLVKVLWKNHPARETTWENEEMMRIDYLHFF
ncbi:putative nucleotidyltransferase, ribonuclease H [Tanacetum coccineum]